MPSQPIEQDFARMAFACRAYAEHLKSNHRAIADVLSAYQSYAVTADEIERSVECLTSLDMIKHFLTRRTKRVCVFFPLNLPVYSLVLFAVIPSLIADQVYLRPPQKMIPVFTKLLTKLGLPEFFPNIHVSFLDRETFVNAFVADADVTIFTGKQSNARKVLKRTKKDGLFLFNGWGCNPIVVAADCDIEVAATKAAEVKLFNAGQDCGGPDTLLVHEQVAAEFIACLRDKVSRSKVGDYSDPDVLVGRIAEDSALVPLASFLVKHRLDVVYGGCIDFAEGIVHPTMIVTPLARQTNYEEFFSPIFYINTYENDEQLAKYFEDPRYAGNEMYVSLFGTSDYVNRLDRSIVYREQTILDCEHGHRPYGGYSVGASFVATQGEIEARPILIPKEMSRFLEAKSKPAAATPEKLPAARQKRIHGDVATALKKYFGDNLIFGFVFGSVARRRATASSDIDTMAVIKEVDESQKEAYLTWLRKYHSRMGLTYDSVYPMELVTVDHLSASLATLDSVTIDINYMPEAEYDAVVWTQVLCGIKRGIVGDEELLYSITKSAGKYPKLWKEEIISQLEKRVGTDKPRADIDPEIADSLKAICKMDPDEVQKYFIGYDYLSEKQKVYGVQKLEAEVGAAASRLLGHEV